jgi:hypothetical protein
VSNSDKQDQLKLCSLLALLVVLLLCLINPLGVASGEQDYHSYSEIKSLLSKTDNAKLAYLSSDLDFYDFDVTQKIRKQYGEAVMLENSKELLNAASFGDWFLNKYLVTNNFTHILVPRESAARYRITHKWGSRGGIDIDLRSPFFTRKLITSGQYPLAVFEITKTVDVKLRETNYSLDFDKSLRPSIYSPIKIQKEAGLYSYSYSQSYLDGPNVSWILSRGSGLEEQPSFTVQSSDDAFVGVQVSIEFVAAYGSNAPDQVVVLSVGDEIFDVLVSVNKPGRIVFTANAGVRVQMRNSLPCRSASSFDVKNMDTRQFCFGISGITVRPLMVQEQNSK